MAYYCKDCSYRGKKSGQLGECPACGSRNLDKPSLQLNGQQPPAKWRLVLLIVLWVFLIALILGKLIS